jgi:hypothetical protein
MTCLSGNSKDYFGAGACAPGAVVVAMFTFIPSSTVAGECEPSLLSTLRMAALAGRPVSGGEPDQRKLEQPASRMARRGRSARRSFIFTPYHVWRRLGDFALNLPSKASILKA